MPLYTKLVIFVHSSTPVNNVHIVHCLRWIQARLSFVRQYVKQSFAVMCVLRAAHKPSGKSRMVEVIFGGKPGCLMLVMR